MITLRVFGVIVVAVEGLIVVVLLFKSAKKAGSSRGLRVVANQRSETSSWSKACSWVKPVRGVSPVRKVEGSKEIWGCSVEGCGPASIAGERGSDLREFIELLLYAHA